MGFVERFDVIESGCWQWKGSVGNSGYGRISVNRKTKYAHRVAYEWAKGPIPEGLHIDHLCRNPLCVNPEHLEPVTPRENARRSPITNMNKTHCPKGHEYTLENIRWKKRKWRDCRECHRIYQRAYQARKREEAISGGAA